MTNKNRLVVAKKGYNALTETDPNNFIFHSDYNSFKIVKQSKQTVTTSAGSNTYTIAHGATQIPPLLVVFAQFPDGKSTLVSFSSVRSYNNSENGIDGHSIDAFWWDSTNMYMYVASVGTAYNIVLVWYELEPELS